MQRRDQIITRLLVPCTGMFAASLTISPIANEFSNLFRHRESGADSMKRKNRAIHREQKRNQLISKAL